MGKERRGEFADRRNIEEGPRAGENRAGFSCCHHGPSGAALPLPCQAGSWTFWACQLVGASESRAEPQEAERSFAKEVRLSPREDTQELGSQGCFGAEMRVREMR